jgi:hypothetical protein
MLFCCFEKNQNEALQTLALRILPIPILRVKGLKGYPGGHLKAIMTFMNFPAGRLHLKTFLLNWSILLKTTEKHAWVYPFMKLMRGRLFLR